ncbi:MAG: dipeptidase [Gemmatimonadales bacterium]|nr:dipeptidase [Gemmatimonadales bacterium]NIN13118.1 dipeptidase [Gemmatimonadales bacterium]NIN51202.1 dipeptidase [Gemmatimonadales bacterium]NIP08666.1 dipeptidase [Gemmatimonadales bacterium]NIR02354.1 dipeptidase [Gemmatimonadales bacterium]
MSDLQTYVATDGDRMLEELNHLLRIPSISALPANAGDCRRAAEWVADQLRNLDCEVKLLASDTHPVVWAKGPAVPGKPVVLVYGHYDVQPPDPLEEWESPPFEPTVRDGNLYARGATDDKGQMFAVVKAFEAVSRGGKPPVNLRFLIEGQEEMGSGVLFRLLDERPELVEADAVLVADTQYFAPGIPAIEVGLRGICYGEIKVRTLKGDLHSGLYGGVAPNAHETLVHILAKLKTEKGRINIPGLYEAVQRPAKAERDAWAKLPFREREFMRDEVGAKALTGLTRYSVFERLWGLPTLEIHGVMGGFTGEGAKTVIPAEATAKVSLRLVPNQKLKTVERQLIKAVKRLAPKYADVSFSFIHGADPVLVDIKAKPFELINQAFEEVEGRGIVFTRSGGSIPVVPALGKKGAPVLLAPNEKLGLDQFMNGVRVFGRFFELLGE